MENTHSCDIYNIDLHRASFAKHLGSKKDLENIKHDELTIPEGKF